MFILDASAFVEQGVTGGHEYVTALHTGLETHDMPDKQMPQRPATYHLDLEGSQHAPKQHRWKLPNHPGCHQPGFATIPSHPNICLRAQRIYYPIPEARA